MMVLRAALGGVPEPNEVLHPPSDPARAIAEVLRKLSEADKDTLNYMIALAAYAGFDGVGFPCTFEQQAWMGDAGPVKVTVRIAEAAHWLHAAIAHGKPARLVVKP